MLLLQYCKLKRKSHGSAQVWIGTLQTRAVDCGYIEYDGSLTKQFTPGLDDEDIITEILRKILALENIDDTTNEWVLIWSQRVETQRVQKEVLNI